MSEYLLKNDDFLVSQTDEKGVILFANDDFCNVAGYKLEELVGQNHNIVRHRDMPKAAFRDLWNTLKSGNIWTGYVKNKRKGDEYYWVYATIYPMQDAITKQKRYMSCRRKASDEEIKSASKLYTTMIQEGKIDVKKYNN